MNRRGVCCAVCVLAVCLGAAVAQPVLRPGPGDPAPDDLVNRILEANGFWLHPPVKSLTYTYRMNLLAKDKAWEASVTYTAPNQLVLTVTGWDPYQGNVDDSYDPENSAGPPRRTTILQGTSLFGPLHEWRAAPDQYDVRLVGEETLDGKACYVLQITPIGDASPEAVQRWEERLRKRASHPQYLYEFLPVEKEIDGVKQAVIELTCVGEEGPGWPDIVAAHEANASEIKWGGSVITAAIRDYRGEMRPIIVMGRDRAFQGQSPIKLTQFAGGVGNMTPKLTLGEGETVLDEALLEKLRAETPKPERYLAMRIGCGIWGSWYGYSGGGARTDQLWIDKATAMVLREEGFARDACRFTVEYGDFADASADRLAPGHVVATLLGDGDINPWIFDMQFTVVDQAAWLLSKLEEYQGGTRHVATAETADAIAEAAE